MKRSATIKPAMRVIAAVVFVCWSVALAVCWHHCATGACSKPSSSSDQPSCHASHDDEKSSGSSSGENACFAKKPFATQLDISPVGMPHLHVAYEAVLSTFTIEVPQSAETLVVRQTRRHGWVFTPEVSLGPAFRAHAPPAFI
jgi:hypothetical protein